VANAAAIERVPTPESRKDARDWSFITGDQPAHDRSGVEFWTLVVGIVLTVAGFVVWGGFSQTGTSDDPPLFPGNFAAGAVLGIMGIALMLWTAWSHFLRR
jgi:hypothetical protein